MNTASLSTGAFHAVSDLFYEVAGIRLTPAKQALVEGRLHKLAQTTGHDCVQTYVVQVLQQRDPAALTQLVNKLTTNETYFFREPQHFDALRRHATQLRPQLSRRGPLRVWSAASSSGEEAYSIAMVLADTLGLSGWEIVGTDLSTDMVETARQGLYPLERARDVPSHLLKRWCLRGHGEHTGRLLVHRELRERVRFGCANLTRPLPDLGDFDIIFLRNVLIYFDVPGKCDVVKRVATRLRPDGLLFTGHAESLSNLEQALRQLAPAVYTHA